MGDQSSQSPNAAFAFDRRGFLAMAGGAIGAGALASPERPEDRDRSRKTKRGGTDTGMKQKAGLREVFHEVDLCVVGGGLAGICAALSAARHGAKVVLMQDRPVLGGNASSECRVHICGADRHGTIPHLRETGILEELRLENVCRNRHHNYGVWDLVLYEKLRFAPNVTLLLNCSCLDAAMDGPHIESVRGWQLTTQTYHTVKAKIFADCSGDAILATLTGAEYRVGHEARSEYGESIAPEAADRRTMGMTCLFQAREYDSPQPFEPPNWIYRFDREEDLPYGADGHHWWRMGYWWVELGGEADTIHDTEALKDELLKISLGVWDHIKNRGSHGAENWDLEWIQFLPGKRESRRYIGEHVLTQRDIESEGRFDDTVAYGGWTMDDHHPAGFRAVKLGAPATTFHPAPAPYGIPYGCLYAKRIDNLVFAGRCHSATHVAISSTRVMGTAAVMGQAVGTAAALAITRGIAPKKVSRHMRALQQQLLDDDCYLPWVKQEYSPLAARSKLEASQGNPEPVRDGFNRQVGDDPHAWICRPGDTISYVFPSKASVEQATLILDSAMHKDLNLTLHYANPDGTKVPDAMVRVFRIEGLNNGRWETIARVVNNCQRHVRIPIHAQVDGIRFVPEETWGAPETRLYMFNVT